MRIPDEEMARLCRSVFGGPLDPETRASIAVLVEGVSAANRTLVSRLSPLAEPEGHLALLRRARRDG